MTDRPAYTLQQLLFSNFDNTNVAKEHDGTSADPTIMLESAFLRNPPANNINGRIIIVNERRGNSIHAAAVRQKNFFVPCYIQYTNVNNFNDVVIKLILAELESVLNVNNYTAGWAYRFTVDTYDYNYDPVNGEIDFVTKCEKKFESAIT